jgi:hypothetical protein
MSGLNRGWLVGALLFTLTACGEEGTREAARAPESGTYDDAFAKTLSQLAPADTVALVRVESKRAQEQLIRAVAERFDVRAEADVTVLLGRAFGVDLAAMDADKPFALAAGASRGKAPVPTLVAPFADAESAAASYSGAKLVRDGYAALTRAPERAEGGTELAAAMRKGTLSLRVDVEQVRRAFAPQIESAFTIAAAAMDQPGRANAAPAKAMLGAFRQRLESTKSLDVTCVRRDGAFEVDGWLHRDAADSMKAGDALDLRPLLARLPRAMAVNGVADIDWSTSAKWLDWQAAGVPIPEDQRGALEKYMARVKESYRMLAPGTAFAMDLGKHGVEAVMVMRARDADAYVDLYMELIKDPFLKELGLVFTDAGERKSGGQRVRRIRLRLDFERLLALVAQSEAGGFDENDKERFVTTMQALLGREGMFLEFASVDRDVVMTIGPDGGLMDRALSSTEVPAGLEPLLARVPGPVRFAMEMDFAPLFAAVRDAIGVAGERDEPALDLDLPFIRIAIASGPGLDRIGVTVR